MVLNDRTDRLARLLDDSEEIFRRVEDEESLESLDRLAPRSVGGVITMSAKIRFIWQSLPESQRASNLEERKRSVNAELDSLMSTPAARDRARDELEFTLEGLPTKTCHFLELQPIFNEVPEFLSQLDLTLILLEELDDYSDLTEEWIRFETLEEVLQCKYERGVDTILEECPRIERTWYPDRFWWRHPVKIFEERDW